MGSSCYISLLITISAAIVVTRVAGGDEQTNVGTDIVSQVFSNPRTIFITSGFLLLMAPFIYISGVVGLAVGGGGYLYTENNKKICKKRRKISRSSGYWKC
jgi:type III secretory pathway component EscV